MTTTVFISGPMSGIPDWNYPAFHAAAEQLRTAGYTVINPAEQGLETTDWVECMQHNLRRLPDADMVAMLPGWENSAGATMEAAVARRFRMPVLPVAKVLDRARVAA